MSESCLWADKNRSVLRTLICAGFGVAPRAHGRSTRPQSSDLSDNVGISLGGPSAPARFSPWRFAQPFWHAAGPRVIDLQPDLAGPTWPLTAALSGVGLVSASVLSAHSPRE